MQLKKVRNIIRWIDKKNVGYYITKTLTGAETDDALKEIQNKFLEDKAASGLCKIQIREFDDTTAIRIDPISAETIGKENLKAIKASIKTLREGLTKEEVSKMRIGIMANKGTCNVFNVKSHTWG